MNRPSEPLDDSAAYTIRLISERLPQLIRKAVELRHAEFSIRGVVRDGRIIAMEMTQTEKFKP